MTTIIAFLIAAVCGAGFVTIWFTTTYADLSAKRDCLADLKKQLHLHEGLYVRERGGPDTQSANRMMETSRMLYREASKSYNQILQKPVNLIPALLMGFRQIKEEDM